MKRKPVIIIAAVAVLGICAFLFIRSKYLAKPKDTEVIAFLEKFNTTVLGGDPEQLLTYFNIPQKSKPLMKLLSVLCNKTGASGSGQPLFEVSLTTAYSDLKIINNELLEVRIPATFSEKNSNNPPRQTFLFMKLRKIGQGEFKILQIDGREFFKDYVAFENVIRTREQPEKQNYDPITLAAFAEAQKLKASYDTIPAFEHYNGKTYYYVVKGSGKEFSFEQVGEDSTLNWKIGLVGPDLKELIPVKYTLIHNISGIIDGLIEVEDKGRRGFYDLNGKEVVPITYDQILPLKGETNLALLHKGQDYFYLKSDLTVSEKIAGLKIADMLPQIKEYGAKSTLTGAESKGLIEFNSREYHASIVFPPSYLVDWEVRPRVQMFKNPLRPDFLSDEEMSEKYLIAFENSPAASNWLTSALYSIEDSYLGGRGGLYSAKALVVVDKKSNTVVGHQMNVDYSTEENPGSESECIESQIRQVNDTLFEFKMSSIYNQTLHNDKLLANGPTFHYLYVKNGRLTELHNKRLFGFTKYVKMDDSYLKGCYIYDDKQLDHPNLEMLQYMKNEIYAEYLYEFKDPKWAEVFQGRFNNYNMEEQKYKRNTSVDDSLTVIDKYNINFLDQKIKAQKASPKVLAAK
ncbi:hypothetical protein BEL04_23060 [Mucilaginibacter sp. PPCGB 2223]|uniref:YARHG domain-containing protein n=1 Tax=Mucilaginibacter sp. PPCGB 2223 TaxID=1886027 RepID=UPI0008270CF8|nr:YARHG domain-containing protein [Mucilaginibacter sp. PPCGB 2223]OCX50652.1 hypothetical protein BEL04_23060 [Mucilaginibacter sp. PPCGB 2223]